MLYTIFETMWHSMKIFHILKILHCCRMIFLWCMLISSWKYIVLFCILVQFKYEEMFIFGSLMREVQIFLILVDITNTDVHFYK